MVGQINYYKTADDMVSGINLLNAGEIKNAQVCQVITKNNLKAYSPYEVTEYGFKNGKTYVARDITLSGMEKRVFLERLVKGELTLYYYNQGHYQTYFIETDSAVLIEVPQKKGKKVVFREILDELTCTCVNVEDAVRFVSYNREAMTKLIERYNHCELKPFPHFRYGIFAGYESTKLISDQSSSDLSNIEYQYQQGYSFGVFADIPLAASDFSIHPEVYFSKHAFSSNTIKGNREYDFVADVTSYKLPVLFRYSPSFNRVRPFVNLGVIFAYSVVKNDVYYERVISDSLVRLNQIISGLWLDNFQLGASVGGGVEIALTYRNSLFIELRYNRLAGFKDSNAFNNSEYSINLSVNF